MSAATAVTARLGAQPALDWSGWCAWAKSCVPGLPIPTYEALRAALRLPNSPCTEAQFLADLVPFIQSKVHDNVSAEFLDELPRLQWPGHVAKFTRGEIVQLICCMLVGLWQGQTAEERDDDPVYASLWHCACSEEPIDATKLACVLQYLCTAQQLYDTPWADAPVVFRMVCTPCASDVHSSADSDEDVSAHAPTLREWEACTAPMSALDLVDHGDIADSPADFAQVDFANSYLGGALTGGSVQEELMFAAAPECIAAMSIAYRMGRTSAIVLCGVQRYAHIEGYGRSATFGGPARSRFPDVTPAESTPSTPTGMTRSAIIAIDALKFQRSAPLSRQLEAPALRRELNKAGAGFIAVVPEAPVQLFPGIATGGWGCGVFCGDLVCKLLIQWAACSAAGRPMRFCMWQAPVPEYIRVMCKACEGRTAGAIVAALRRCYSQRVANSRALAEAVVRQLEEEDASD